MSVALRRNQIRRYLLALLHHDGVPQSSDCNTDYLWTNCDGSPAPVLDHENHQIDSNVDGGIDKSPKNAVISYKFDRVRYEMIPTRAVKTTVDLQIDIIAFESSGEKRTDICDIIEERILYRLLSQQSFIDESTGANGGQTLVSFVRFIDENGFNIESLDDQSFDGNYTIRELTMSFTFTEKIERPDCDMVPICFDFKTLTPLDKDG